MKREYLLRQLEKRGSSELHNKKRDTADKGIVWSTLCVLIHYTIVPVTSIALRYHCAATNSPVTVPAPKINRTVYRITGRRRILLTDHLNFVKCLMFAAKQCDATKLDCTQCAVRNLWLVVNHHNDDN